MNTSQLECFISLAGTLNYMKTSEQLGLTQPAVTKQIQALESELGCRLFNRTTRSVTLTEAGEIFLADAKQVMDTFYHSVEHLSNFKQRDMQSLKIGYMDSNTIPLISRILKPLLAEKNNVIPAFSQDQTDANLRRLVNGQLDVVIGMKDAKFSDSNIVFTKLYEEKCYCVLHKDHPLVKEKKKDRKKTTTTEELCEYRQVIAVPPYLLRKYFSRGRSIVPVNDNLDNVVCSNAGEAYGLLLAGFGYALLPENVILKHPDLVVYEWEESPHAPFGIYSNTSVLKDKASAEYVFIKSAKNLFADEK